MDEKNKTGKKTEEILKNVYDMEELGEKKEDFEMSRTEVEQLKNAFKDQKFRQLLSDYVDEVRDPENQLLYQREMTELEKQRGNMVHFINPVPGYVLKSSIDGETKAFINVCTNTLIMKPNFEAAVQDSKHGSMWSIPYTQSPARDDLDKAGKKCVVYDVIFNPEALFLAKRNPLLLEKLEQTAMDAVESSFKVKLDRVNVRKPKLSYKGLKTSITIKYKIGESPPKVIDASVIGKESPPLTDSPRNPGTSSKKVTNSDENSKNKNTNPKTKSKKDTSSTTSDEDNYTQKV